MFQQGTSHAVTIIMLLVVCGARQLHVIANGQHHLQQGRSHPHFQKADAGMCHAQLQGPGNPSTATGFWLLIAAAAASLLSCWVHTSEVACQQLIRRVQQCWQTVVTACHDQDWVAHWVEARNEEGCFQLLQP
jgi:hypothetical protein